jgi:signal transduction histidine kinase
MWHSKSYKQLAVSHSQLESLILERTVELQILSERLLKVQDEERRKLARDLHDSTGQTLAALKMTVSFLQNNCKDDAKMTDLTAELAVLADQASDEVRTMSYLLHPPLLDEIGFTCAAEWYIEGFAKRCGISVSADFAKLAERLPMNIELVFFRVLQESLTNTHRHSGASEASVSFQRHPETAILEIRDFGCGIPADRLARLREASAESGVGLAGMRERLREFNGKLEMESDAHGTTMRAIIPLLAATQSAQRKDGIPYADLQSVPRVNKGQPPAAQD